MGHPPLKPKGGLNGPPAALPNRMFFIAHLQVNLTAIKPQIRTDAEYTDPRSSLPPGPHLLRSLPCNRSVVVK
jgi:hypothetical protein